MYVSIIETETGRVVTEIAVNEGMIDDTPTGDGDYAKDAWKAAVDDGVVDEADRDKYTFQVHREPRRV